MTCTAQDKQITLGNDTWYYQFSVGAATDTIGSSDTTYYLQWLTNKDMGLLYNVKTKLTEVSGTATVAVSIQGKVHSDDSWSNIATQTYYGAGSDTTLVFTQTSTAQFYRYFRLYYDCTTSAQKVKISTAYIKHWHL